MINFKRLRKQLISEHDETMQKKEPRAANSGFLNVSEKFFRHVWTVECGLSTLFTPVEPLANEVGDDVPHDGCRDGHHKISEHDGHLLSQGSSRPYEFILAENFLRGKLLKIFSTCDKLCAVNENTTQSDHKTENKNRTPGFADSGFKRP